MAKKINFNLEATLVTDIRTTLIPATKELKFWKDYRVTVAQDFESLTAEERNTYGKVTADLLLTINVNVDKYENIVKRQKDAYKFLLPNEHLGAIKDSFTFKSEARPDVCVLAWLKSLGADIEEGVTTRNIKLYNALIGGAGKLFKVTDKGTPSQDLVVKSDTVIRKELVNSLIQYLVYNRKQYVIGGTAINPTFTKKACATSETAIL